MGITVAVLPAALTPGFRSGSGCRWANPVSTGLVPCARGPRVHGPCTVRTGPRVHGGQTPVCTGYTVVPVLLLLCLPFLASFSSTCTYLCLSCLLCFVAIVFQTLLTRGPSSVASAPRQVPGNSLWLLVSRPKEVVRALRWAVFAVPPPSSQ